MGIELPGWLRYVGSLVGEKFPEGDETACRRQRDSWQSFADQLEAHNAAIQAAARSALDGFSAGATHDALIPQLSSLTSGDQSIDEIVEQLRGLAHAVDEAATEIEFAKQMFIVNLGILAASLAAMIASAWINWGAPAEMAAAIAATEAVLAQIIRAAIGKLVSAAALRIVERLAIKALEGAAMNAIISGGMNAAVQGGQILEGHRHDFDWGSFGADVGAGAIQGAVAAPFLRGVHERTPGYHPSERFSEFSRSFAGNTLGGLAAQAPSGQFDLGNAAKGGLVFGAMDGGRLTPKSLKADWAGRGASSDRSAPTAPEAKPDRSPPKGPELSEPAPVPPTHGVEDNRNGSGGVDVPLNLGAGDHGTGGTGPTQSGADAASASNSATAPPTTSQPSAEPAAPDPAASRPASSPSSTPRASVSDTSASSNAEPTGTTAARSADSVATQPLSGRNMGDTTPASFGTADTAPPVKTTDVADSVAPPAHHPIDGAAPRHPELADPALSPRIPDRADAPPPKTPDRVVEAGPAAKGLDRTEPAPPPKVPDRLDAAAPKPESTRPVESSPPQIDAAKTPAASSATDLSARPAHPEVRAGADNAASKRDGDPRPDPAPRHEPGIPDAAAMAPILVGPVLHSLDSALHHGSAAAPEARVPQAVKAGDPGRAGPNPAGTNRAEPAVTAPPSERGESGRHADAGIDAGPPDPHPTHVDPSELPPYRRRQIELALSPEALERDLLANGCPPDIAASARHSPYEGMTPQQLLDRYCHPDGSVRWPPHDGFADGRYEVAQRITEGEPLDRIGEISSIRGDFMGSAGDSYPGRGLAPGSSGPYHRLEGTGKEFSRPSWELRYGKVAEAFDQPGGGRQWVVVDTDKIIDGAPKKILIDQLIQEGYLRVVEIDRHPPRTDHTGHLDRPPVVGDGTARVEHIRQLVNEYRTSAIQPVAGDHGHASVHPDGDDARRRDWNPPPHDHEPLFDGDELTADEREALRDVWAGLSPDERRYLFRHEPMFGEHAELPVRECDHYTRQALRDMRNELTARIAEPGDADRARVLDNIEQSVQQHADQPERFLLGFESDGRSITAVGNPDTARATVVFVPGTFTGDDKLNDHLEGRGVKNLFGLRPRYEKAGYMEVCERIDGALRRKLSHSEMAVVDYQNYHAPQSLWNPATGAPNPRFAEEGAPSLRNHLNRLQHTNHGADGKLWVAGHSYGTVLVGVGAKGGRGLNADGIINLGSPGMRVHDVSGLQLKGLHLVAGEAPVHTMTRVDDPIHLVDGARLMGLDHVNVGHGLMPHHPEFGGHVWNVDTNAGLQRDPHNAYFEPGGEALKNIAEIVAGELPPPQDPRLWSTRHALPFTTGYFRPPPAAPTLGGQVSDDRQSLAEYQRRLAEYHSEYAGAALPPSRIGEAAAAQAELERLWNLLMSESEKLHRSGEPR